MNASSRRIVIVGLGLIILIAVAALALFAFLQFAPAEVEEEPSAVATTTPTSPTAATSISMPPATAANMTDTATPQPSEASPEPQLPGGSDAWAEIQERGTLLVGTAADYPPFAFYTDEFELDGFDVALARAIGRHLGVEVEMRDMAFDGLAGALEVGQIDLAIAAISVTEERKALIDFSQVYFVSEDAILARDDNTTIISAVEDLAGFRVGVQNASVFQDWLQTNLIDPGLMPAENLLVYSKIDEAAVDLEDGLIDFIVGDLLPAQVAAETGDFALAGQGLNRQHFAAAMRQGSTLLEPVNEALAELAGDGELAQLVETYLGLRAEDVLPLPSPAPPPAAPSGRANFGCIDAMTLVRHLSFDDQDMAAPAVFAPGQNFAKGWRVRNDGTCTWDNSYVLVYAGGNDPAARMGGQPLVITGEVAPNAEVDLTLNLVAPLVPGEYQGFWSMRASNGLLFGDRLPVGVRVEAAPTATPLPTAPPSPAISFTADPSQLTAGGCTTFTWDVRDAANVYLSAAGEPWQLSQVEARGTQQECPPVTTIFELRVVQTDGSVEVRQQRIDVQPPPANAAQITSFSVTPDFQIAIGQCVQIAWQVTGSATQVRLLRNDTPLWANAPLSGGLEDCPPAGNMVYAIEVSGSGETVRAQREVIVIVPSATATAVSIPTPTPTGPPPPVINSFSVQPTRIQTGQCVTINWSVGGGANRVQITRNGSLLLDNGQLTGVATDCLVNSGTFTYRVEALNQANQSAFQQAAVTVDQPTANNPLLGSWTLISLNGQIMSRAVLITAVFGDGGNLSGNAGCNNYSTFYQVNSASLFIGPFSLGQNVCLDPPDIMQLEGRYLSALQSSNSFAINNDELTLSGSGELIFIRN